MEHNGIDAMNKAMQLLLSERRQADASKCVSVPNRKKIAEYKIGRSQDSLQGLLSSCSHQMLISPAQAMAPWAADKPASLPDNQAQ